MSNYFTLTQKANPEKLLIPILDCSIVHLILREKEEKFQTKEP